MGTIVAIGGGELKDLDTLPIDKEIVRLTGKKHPRALFIPTASGDAEGYWKTFQSIYGEKLGCTSEVLYLIRESPSPKELREKILGADLIYVGGGNTLKMLKIWRQKGVDAALKQAYEKGAVLSGISAGAICWFSSGCSDSKRFSNAADASFMKVTGLKLIPLTLSPHHIREAHRDKGLEQLMKRTSGVGIALDDNCALEIVGNTYRFINSQPNAGAKRVYWTEGKLHTEKMSLSETFFPLHSLTHKK